MLNDTMMAYTEIDEILNQLDIKYVEKIPKKLRELFKEEKQRKQKGKKIKKK